MRAEFLAIGQAVRSRQDGAYFLGKADYTKGYREMFDAMKLYRQTHGADAEIPHVDTYGSGKDFEDIVRVRSPGRVDKAAPLQTGI